MSHTVLFLKVLKTIPVIAVSSLVVCAALVTRRAARVINQRTIVKASCPGKCKFSFAQSKAAKKRVVHENRKTQVILHAVKNR